jgi:hypothetical protein
MPVSSLIKKKSTCGHQHILSRSFPACSQASITNPGVCARLVTGRDLAQNEVRVQLSQRELDAVDIYARTMKELRKTSNDTKLNSFMATRKACPCLLSERRCTVLCRGKMVFLLLVHKGFVEAPSISANASCLRKLVLKHQLNCHEVLSLSLRPPITPLRSFDI